MSTDGRDLPELPSRSELVEILGGTCGPLEDYLERAIALGVSNITFEDHLVIAALRRALDNVQGMLAMVDQENLFCGMPIVRFQVDTAMTLYGRNLVSDVDDYVTHMLKGNERRKYRDRDGNKMTDGYLHGRLTGHHEHTSELYSETSAYVHFSQHHLHRVLDLDHLRRAGEVAFRSHDEIVAGWPDVEIRGALVQFLYASDIVRSECEQWERDRLLG